MLYLILVNIIIIVKKEEVIVVIIFDISLYYNNIQKGSGYGWHGIDNWLAMLVNIQNEGVIFLHWKRNR